MKILQTPTRFYPYTGGVENYVYYLSKELVKLGHEVKVMCASEPKLEDKEIDGIEVERLDYTGKIANTNITPSLPLHLLKEDFDVLHAHLPTPWSADWSAVVSAVKRKPLVLTYHNDIVGGDIANYIARVYNLTALRFLLKRARKIIATNSNYIKSSPHLKRYKEKIEIIPVGVDIERFQHRDTNVKDTIFFLSVLDEFHVYKGLNYLLETLKLVKKEIPKVKLIVGGGGKLLEQYKGKTATLGLEENVDFLGYVPNEKTLEYYRNCNLFILPSISATQEGFGMVLLEAMACGRPVVSTSIVGVAEDIEKHDAGMVVKPMDKRALGDAMIRILQDKKEAERMGANGRKLVEKRYSWDGIAENIEKIYNSSKV